MGELPPELLEVLVCPHTQKPLKMASSALLQELNDAIGRGAIRNRRGDLVGDPIDGALVCDGGNYAYLIIQGIADLIWDESIEITT